MVVVIEPSGSCDEVVRRVLFVLVFIMVMTMIMVAMFTQCDDNGNIGVLVDHFGNGMHRGFWRGWNLITN